MLKSKRSLVAVLVFACSSEEAPVSIDVDAAAFEATVLIESTGVSILDIVPAASRPLQKGSGPRLRYLLEDSTGQMVLAGQIHDPRVVSVEWLEDGQIQRQEVTRESGIVRLRLPSIAGDLVVLPASEVGGPEVGRARYEPTGVRRMGLVDPSLDVLGGAVKVVDNAGATINLLFLPEAYTEAELGKFHADVDRVIAGLSSMPDFAAHWDRFNIWRQDVRSAQSGANDPWTGDVTNTAFDTAYGDDVRSPRRLLCFDSPAGHHAAMDLGAAISADAAVVLVNEAEYGGCGVADAPVFAAIEDSALIAPLMAHELGHSLFDLADEYDYGLKDCAPCGTGINVVGSTVRAEIPWHDLIAETTALPTPAEIGLDVVGAFVGAGYCPNNCYRPEFSCLMRALDSRMCDVCARAMAARMGAPYSSGDTGSEGGGLACGDPACDLNWCGLQQEDNCPEKWFENGQCDCGCQRHDPDCGPAPGEPGGPGGKGDEEDVVVTDPSCAPDRYEPNNVSYEDTPATPGQTYCELSICGADDWDWFGFDVTSGFGAEIHFLNAQGDLDLEIYSAATLGYVAGSYTTTDRESVTLSGLGAGRYWARVYHYAGAQNPGYCFTVSVW